MQKDKLAGVISVLTFIALFVCLNALADAFGILTYTYSSGESFVTCWGEETNGMGTQFAYYIIFASGMLAWRVYRWVKFGSPDGNLKIEQKKSWSRWFVGITAYIVITTPIHSFDVPSIFKVLLNIGIAVGILVLYNNNKHTKGYYLK